MQSKRERERNGSMFDCCFSHAGYSYSGPTAAFAYKEIDPSTV